VNAWSSAKEDVVKASRIIDFLKIVETYEPPELSDDVVKKVPNIVKDIEGELGVDGGTSKSRVSSKE